MKESQVRGDTRSRTRYMRVTLGHAIGARHHSVFRMRGNASPTPRRPADGRGSAGRAANFEQLKTESFDLTQHSVQRRLVG
jgi:hypothetical protein